MYWKKYIFLSDGNQEAEKIPENDQIDEYLEK
jgi:hypothetical protein